MSKHTTNPPTPLAVQVCDCCGMRMQAHLCKLSCPNCGYRLDCSDLTLNFDDSAKPASRPPLRRVAR